MKAKLQEMKEILDELLFLAPLSSTLPGGDVKKAECALTSSPIQKLHVPLTSVQSVGNQNTVAEKALVKSPLPDFNEIKVAAIRARSCSRKNFATNLARELFSYDERCSSNVSGTCGKEKLDTKRMEVIKKFCFENFPLSTTENSYKAWHDCIKAIDTAGRSLVRKNKENR